MRVCFPIARASWREDTEPDMKETDLGEGPILGYLALAIALAVMLAA
jgi:hypothetical protein